MPPLELGVLDERIAEFAGERSGAPDCDGERERRGEAAAREGENEWHGGRVGVGGTGRGGRELDGSAECGVRC